MVKIMIPNAGEAEEAEYKEQVIPQYKDNPFIEALPPIYAPEEVIERLSAYSTYFEAERDLDAHYRIHLVQNLFKCFQALPLHLDLESRISRVIRQGYIPRNPVSKEYVARFKGANMVVSNTDINTSQQFQSTACGFTIIGVSGMGKSVSMNRILSMYPQVIVHSRYKNKGFSFYQLIWIKLDCPFDGSVKGLCIQFFNKIDQLLGTDYYRKVANSKTSIDYMLTLMANSVSAVGIGVIIIDEVQALCGARLGEERMLNFFVSLVNSVGVPIILISNPKGMSILQSEFRQARRGSGQGDMVWDRLKCDDSFEFLIDSLWQYQWTKKESSLTQGMKEMLYEESQGVIDIVVKLLVMAQTVAIFTGKEVLTEGLISQVVRDHFQLVRPMLVALRSGNMREIAKYSDICTTEIDYSKVLDQGKQSLEMQARIKALKEQKEKKATDTKMSKLQQVIAKLLELGVEAKKAQKAAEQVISKVEDQDVVIGDLAIRAVQTLASSSDKTSKASKTKKAPRSEHDVHYIVEEGRRSGKTAYESLKLQEYIEEVDTLFKGRDKS